MERFGPFQQSHAVFHTSHGAVCKKILGQGNTVCLWWLVVVPILGVSIISHALSPRAIPLKTPRAWEVLSWSFALILGHSTMAAEPEQACQPAPRFRAASNSRAPRVASRIRGGLGALRWLLLLKAMASLRTVAWAAPKAVVKKALRCQVVPRLQ